MDVSNCSFFSDSQFLICPILFTSGGFSMSFSSSFPIFSYDPPSSPGENGGGGLHHGPRGQPGAVVDEALDLDRGVGLRPGAGGGRRGEAGEATATSQGGSER